MTAMAKSAIPKGFLTGREPTLTFLAVLVIGLGLYYLNSLLALSTSLANVISPTIYNALFGQLVTYYPTGLFVFLNTIFSWMYSFPSIFAWFVGGLVLGILLKKKAKKFVAYNQSSDMPIVISKAEVSKAWVVWGLFRVSLFFIAITYTILGVLYIGLTLTGSADVDLLTGIAGFMLFVLTLFLSPVFWMHFAFVALGGAIGTSMARRASNPIAREAGQVSFKPKGKEMSKKEKMLAAYQPKGKATLEGSQLRVTAAAVPSASGKSVTKVPQTVPAVPAPTKVPAVPAVPALMKVPQTVPSIPAPAKASVTFPPVPAPIKAPETVPSIPAPARAPVIVPSVPATVEKPVPKLPVVTPLTTNIPQPTPLQQVSAPFKPTVTVPTPAAAPISTPVTPSPTAPTVEEPTTPEEEQFFKQVMTGIKLVMTKLDKGEIIDPAFVSNLLYLLRTRRKKFEQQGAASKIKKVEEMYQKTEQLQTQVRARAKSAPEKK